MSRKSSLIYIFFNLEFYSAFKKKIRDFDDLGHDGHLPYKRCSNHQSSRICDLSSVTKIWNKNEKWEQKQKQRACCEQKTISLG